MKRNKIKDMIRSILPSKARRRARLTKATLNRNVRRAVRHDLNVENFDADLRRKPYFRSMLWERRGADKLNHFMRWCEAITAGMSAEDALSYVRSLLPDSLIGDHAYGHWEAHRKPNRYRTWPYVSHKRREQSFIDSTTFRLRRALMVDPSLHARLNAEIKARTPEERPWRVLAGIHDVEAFVRDINELERTITLELIEQIEKQKGGRKVALRVYGSRRAKPFAAGLTLSNRRSNLALRGSAALCRRSRGPRVLCGRPPHRAAEPLGRCARAACPKRCRRTILRRANSIRRTSPSMWRGSAA